MDEETPAEVYLRSNFGAVRAHFAWRELKEAYTAGYLKALEDMQASLEDLKEEGNHESRNRRALASIKARTNKFDY